MYDGPVFSGILVVVGTIAPAMIGAAAIPILVTENQNYILRRLQQFIDIVEDQIDGYEKNEISRDDPYKAIINSF